MWLACCQPAHSQAEIVNQHPPSHLSPRWLAEEAGLPKSAPNQARRGDKHLSTQKCPRRVDRSDATTARCGWGGRDSESRRWHCLKLANGSGTPTHPALTPSPALFAPPKRLFHNQHGGAEPLKAPSATSSRRLQFLATGLEPGLARARASSSDTPKPSVGALGPLAGTLPPSSASARPGRATSDPALPARSIPGGARGGAQAALPPAGSAPAARRPWGRGWAGGPGPKRARRLGRRRGAGRRPMSAGCAGSARSSPRSASGGQSAPSSCCASCAR